MNYTRTSSNTAAINGHSLSFGSEIVGEVVYADRVVLLINSYHWDPTDPNSGRNIYCYDDKGERVWQVADTGVKLPLADGRFEYRNFLRLWHDASTDELWAASLYRRFLIDKETGKIVRDELKD